MTMVSFNKISICGALLVSVTACGGTGLSGPVTFEEFDARVENIIAIPGTAFEGVPLSGRANFSGVSQVVVLASETEGSIGLIGTSDVEIDFNGFRVSGTLTNFVEDRSNGAIKYSGALSVSPTAFDLERPNTAYAFVEGQLQGDGNTIRVPTRTQEVRVLGTPVRALTSLQPQEGEPGFFNGRNRNVFVGFWGNRD